MAYIYDPKKKRDLSSVVLIRKGKAKEKEVNYHSEVHLLQSCSPLNLFKIFQDEGPAPTTLKEIRQI